MNKKPTSNYKIRFSDCDLFGHLNNARYLDYFLQAREEHLENHYELRLDSYYKEGTSWVVGGHQIAYLKPAMYAENVAIETRLLHAGESELLVEMIMTDQNHSHLKSLLWTKFIPIDIKTARRRTHPDDFMTFAKGIELPLEGFVDFNTRTMNIINEMATVKQ